MALTEEEKQDLLNAIRQESTGIDELETAESLDGLTSLPAMSGDKLVRAPIALLSKPAADAAQDARTAAGNADTAATAAGSAARNAAEKAREADEAAKKALLAAESVNGYIGTVDVQELDALSTADKAGVYKVTENKNAAGWLLVHTDGGGHQVTQTLLSNYTDGSGGTLDFTTHRDDAVTVYTRHYNIGSATLDGKETARGTWTPWTETGGTNLAEGLASTVAALDKETTDRKNADTELQTAIDEETTARVEADSELQAGVDAAKGGASARFKDWLETGEILQMSTTATGGKVVFVEDKGRFAYSVGGRLYNNWGTADMYMDAARQHPLEDKVYLYGYAAWVWKAEDATLVKASGAGGGAYDVTREIPLPSGYYTLESAVAALQDADIAVEDKPGFLMTFEYAGGKWADYRFNNYDTGNFDDPDCWEAYGGGRIRRITLNGKEVTPGADGEVDLRVNDVTVDESLAADSTNPVQNKAVTARLEEIGDAAVGGVEVIEDGDKNTLNILNKKGGVIASTEFAGGGGGGASTASRIILAASVDKAQVKEGGTARLSYTYNHVNAEGAGDGVKADITVTVSRGTTQTYSQTVKGVGAGTYTLDISDYLLVGTTEIYVKAEAVTEDGTRQTKQAYVSVNVITLTLVSGYNLGTAMQQGGYHDGDTVEIPFSITGSGTKDISMYLDGGETPTTQTISKSGTVNGSFSIAASSLAAGLHSVQLVAERDGLRSDSIYMEILKAGTAAVPFVGVKYTDTAGTVQTGTASPRLSVAQYGTLRFHYVAYDPDSTVAQVEISVDGQRTATIGAPRTMQEYTNRMTGRGQHTVTLRVGKTEREMAVEVTESGVDIGEATYGLVARLDASGRSNGEENPAVWESNGIETTFEGFDWASNGWTGDALKLTNGAKAVIGYEPFRTDVKATGLTIEITMRVSNVNRRGGSVVSCMDKGKGLLVTCEEAGFKTGQTVTYTNEDGVLTEREVGLGTKFVDGKWMKIALMVDTRANHRLMHLYVDGNRTGADIYDSSFSFAQDTPQPITIDSSEADVEIRCIRIYSRALTDDEELENRMVDETTADAMLALYAENDILGDTGGVDMDKVRKQGKGVLRIVRANKLDDVYAENNKKTDFKADIYFYSPYGKEYDFVLTDCNIRIQGTSSTKYPSKNIRIYLNKGGEDLSLTVGGVADPHGKNRYAMRAGAVPMNLLCCKSDYSDSSMSLNTGGAKLFNDIFKELGLLTPPQRHQYEQGGGQLSAVNVRTAIDGLPIDIFCAETVDGESEYYGQYNLNNEKSKSGALFGMEGVDGYTPECPLTLETLNNGADACLFKSAGDDDFAANFDAGLETNVPDDVKWAGLDTAQQDALKRLYGWIRACVPAGASADDLTTFRSEKFVNEINQYFDKDFLLTYYLWTDYFLSVDQRAKNMLLRTWDGLKWYITYYDGDTQLGKRNDCFLVYGYTTDRDTWDAEAGKYAFEGRESWLWNLVLANLQDDLRACAARLRAVMTNERVLEMLNTEQSGNWSCRASNKSGELKYIKPAVGEMYGKVWPFIYALQGANTAHREYFIKNRFALLDAKYGTANFTSDNIDLYINRQATYAADKVRVTANEPYAFGYGTNNSPNIQNTGIIGEGETAELSITGAYTVNDPLRLYGASRVRVLDMTGAADHLKNGLDLGKCGALRELNLESEADGSTGWWLVLGGCKSLRRLNVRDQRQAKTGGSTSKELDLTAQTKLEWLDARGTQVESVVLAQGAPVTEAHLPATIRTLRLEYLPKLTDAGLTMEGRESVETFVFAGCPNMDWEEQLRKCANVRRVRVTGIDITDGNGSLLNKYMGTGGVDADGNATDTCGLVGTYRLKRYTDAERIAAWRAHYPELDIRQPEYTVLLHDDTVADPANVTNLDNNTGCDYGTAYEPSGHVSEILSRRHRVLAKNTGLGKNTVCRLHDRNSFYFADAEKTAEATPASLSGDMGDFMMDEPRYWFKGVNDLVNRKKYSVFSTREDAPGGTHASRRLTRDEVATHATDTAADGITVLGTVAEAMVDGAAGYNVMSVEVAGWARVRWPSVAHAQYGAVMADAEGNIVRRVKAAVSSGIADGEYVFADVPAGAVTLYFTIKQDAPFDYVLLTQSVKPEDIEEDWVLHERMLRSVVLATNTGSVYKGTTSVSYMDNSIPQNGLADKFAARGKGYCMMDYDAWRDMALMFMAKYGTRDLQGTCGRGRYGDVPADWCKYGMQDTVADNSDSDGWSLITNADGVTERVGNPTAIGYYMAPRVLARAAIDIAVLHTNGNIGVGNGMARRMKFTRADGTEVTSRTYDGVSAFVSLVTWGRHSDILPAMLLGSGTTHTCDEYKGYSGCSGTTKLFLGRSSSYETLGYTNNVYEDSFGLFNIGMNSGGGDTCHGSYLLFRGDIEETSDVEAFKEMQEI